MKIGSASRLLVVPWHQALIGCALASGFDWQISNISSFYIVCSLFIAT